MSSSEIYEGLWTLAWWSKDVPVSSGDFPPGTFPSGVEMKVAPGKPGQLEFLWRNAGDQPCRMELFFGNGWVGRSDFDLEIGDERFPCHSAEVQSVRSTDGKNQLLVGFLLAKSDAPPNTGNAGTFVAQATPDPPQPPGPPRDRAAG